MLTGEPLLDAHAFRALEERLQREPLLTFGWPGEPHRAFAAYVAQGVEALLRGSGSSGKTRTGAAILVAAAKGDETLNGMPLPQLAIPATCWVLCQTYKQQVDAAQAAVLLYVGEWPHKIAWVAGETRGYVENIWLATSLCSHGTDEKCRTCSKIVFHCAESRSSVGGRIDMAWADEPPDERTWREVRWRGHGDRKLYRFITATPIDEQWWGWMPGDFDGTERKPMNGRVEVRATMKDNRFLLASVIADKIEAARGDPLEKARLNGDYVHMKGTCPYPPDRLELWMRRTRPPLRTDVVTVNARRDESDGATAVPVRCRIEVFADREPGEEYIIVMDPSMYYFVDPQTGIIADKAMTARRGALAPAGLHVYARRRRRLAVRFRGYSGAYGCAWLAGLLAPAYNEALVDCDLTGGYGEPAIAALTEQGYYNFARATADESSPSARPDSLGFKINARSRARMSSMTLLALMEDSILIESEAVVRSLMGVSYEELPNGTHRWAAGKETGNEDPICLGRFLHLDATLPPVPPMRAEDRLHAALPWVPLRAFGERRAGESIDAVEMA